MVKLGSRKYCICIAAEKAILGRKLGMGPFILRDVFFGLPTSHAFISPMRSTCSADASKLAKMAKNLQNTKF